jgi:hypothetical protein
MGSKQVRTGQLIAPFGPGSIYTDRHGIPQVVAGLDHWFKRWDQFLGKMIICDDPTEFEIFEGRLSALLKIDRLCCPPDYRHALKDAEPPPNSRLNVPALRFPRWYRHTRTGAMRRFNLDSTRLEKTSGGGRWQPVRFISVCASGHLGEFPWKDWIDCQCTDDGDLYLTDRGGSELSSIRVECRSCPDGSQGRRGRNLSGTTVKPDVQSGELSAFQKAGIRCPGDRPWLGEGANDSLCTSALVGALINQTNIYFPRTLSAISLPDLALQDDSIAKLCVEIQQDASLGVAKTLWTMKNEKGAVALAQVGLASRGIVSSDEQVNSALKSLFAPVAAVPSGSVEPVIPESELLTFRRSEFNIIRNEVNDPEHVPDLRVIPVTVPPEVSPWIFKVNLVERLRETRAFYGFDRLEPVAAPLDGMPDAALNQLFLHPPKQSQDRWLPAIEVFGEGIYIELSEDCIGSWQTEQASWLNDRLDDGFVARLAGIFQTLPPLAAADRHWASRYLLVHSFAHTLINQLVFECGYSTAALRERLFVSSDPAAPMAGLLIYTAAGDAEGTLGGLVRLGRPERLGPVIQRALSRASWCSADPVCSEQLGGQGSRQANLAACHACVLLPETCCETINHGLDRAMVVGTPEERTRGFLSRLLNSAYDDT